MDAHNLIAIAYQQLLLFISAGGTAPPAGASADPAARAPTDIAAPERVIPTSIWSAKSNLNRT